MSDPMRVGVIGCGNISTAYFKLSKMFRAIEMVACADLNPDTAAAQAEAFGLRAMSVEALLAADDVDDFGWARRRGGRARDPKRCPE